MHEVAITDLQIPFWRLVVIMLKVMIAAIPAAIITTMIFWMTIMIFGTYFNSLLLRMFYMR
jgi:hypothetical protein